jgi:hypothetical protein
MASLSAVTLSADLSAVPPDSAAVKRVYNAIANILEKLWLVLLTEIVPYEDPYILVAHTLRVTVLRLASDDVLSLRLISDNRLPGARATVRLPQVWDTRAQLWVDTLVVEWATQRHKQAGVALLSPILTVILSIDSSPKVVAAANFTRHPLTVDMLVALTPEGLPSCEFWDLKASSWSNQGCLAMGNNETLLECACFYFDFTDFAATLRGTQTIFSPRVPNDARISVVLQSPRPNFYPLITISIIVVATLLVALVGRSCDKMQRRRFRPDIQPELMGSGYMKATARSVRKGPRFGVLISMWGGMMFDYFRHRHGIFSILLWTPRDTFTRPPRIAALLLYLTTSMAVAMLLFVYIGLTDDDSFVTGLLTAIILIPLFPLTTLMLRSIAPHKRRSTPYDNMQKPAPNSVENAIPSVQGVVMFTPEVEMDVHAQRLQQHYAGIQRTGSEWQRQIRESEEERRMSMFYPEEEVWASGEQFGYRRSYHNVYEEEVAPDEVRCPSIFCACCVYVYMYMYIYMRYIYIYIYICPFICACIHYNLRVHKRVHKYMHKNTRVHKYMHSYTRTFHEQKTHNTDTPVHVGQFQGPRPELRVV